jgi:phosphoglycolate phosphatase
VSAVVLFDIDLTMIRTNGAGSGAMTETLKELLDIDDGFAGVDFVGRTDRAILRDALTNHGHIDTDFDVFVATFEQHYLPRLARNLQERRGEVLPGVRETLRAIAAIPGTRLGLATGNFRRAAEIKLRYFELWEHFEDGGFADDGELRADLVAAAMRRMSGAGVTPRACFVVGDSVHDVRAAKDNGATAIAVATGVASTAMLAAAGADLVLSDLSEPSRLLGALASLASP